jgi:hypothetical protein
MDFIQKVISFNACTTQAFFGFQIDGCFIIDSSWTLKNTEEFIEKKLIDCQGVNKCGYGINLIELHIRAKNNLTNKNVEAKTYRYNFKTKKLILQEHCFEYPMLNTEGYPLAT